MPSRVIFVNIVVLKDSGSALPTSSEPQNQIANNDIDFEPKLERVQSPYPRRSPVLERHTRMTGRWVLHRPLNRVGSKATNIRTGHSTMIAYKRDEIHAD